MKAILLDGSYANDATGKRVRAAVRVQLENRGWDVIGITLRERKIGICAGDFFCWTRTPGECNVDDDNRAIAAAIMASDVLVYLTPVTFGGYSSALKRMVDHQIQNISPYFAKIAGETHHQPRYEKNPALLAIGWMDVSEPRTEAVYRHLVQRNAINFHAATWVSAVVFPGQTDEQMLACAQDWINQLLHGQSSAEVELPPSGTTEPEPGALRRALLLIGSPRTHTSTSNALGEYLFERLGAHDVQTETLYVHQLRSPKKMQSLFDAVDAADLVALAFPVYVDSLPAPVTETLERIAGHRLNWTTHRPQLFAAIANCGFPEARQAATALAICENFARQSHFTWAGSLALGGGEMVGGVPLAAGGRRTLRIRKSLDMAADALLQTGAIPPAAQDLLQKPFIPDWLYRLIGSWGWRWQARRYGAQNSLTRQPYLRTAK